MEQNIKNKHFLSYVMICICALVFIICMGVFICGQYQANNSIRDAGNAVLNATNQQTNSQQEVDYTSAIIYLQTAQQAYSENSMVRLTSIIYVLASTIILGYGAKMLRLGKEDKDELIETLYKHTKEQLDAYTTAYQTSIDQLYAQTGENLNSYIMKSQEALTEAKGEIFENIDCVSVLLNSSGNALYLCFLLQSYFEILPLCTDDQQRNNYINTLERLEMEMIHSLQVLLDYMQVLYESNFPVNKNLQDMIHRNLILLRNSFNGFSSIDKPKCLKDDKTINRLLKECENLCERHNEYS